MGYHVALSSNHPDDGTAYKVNLNLTGDLDVQSGGLINADSKGYIGNNGPGKPSSGYAGGSYGGNGNGTGGYGYTYGSLTAPKDLGSGTQADAGVSGGGGAILAVSGATTVNGTISAIGAEGFTGGSGGSVFLTTGTISGSGYVKTNGGAGTGDGGGGGGRTAIVLSSGSSFDSVNFQSYGGSAGYKGAAGTVYKKTASQTYGAVNIDNNSQANSGPITTLYGNGTNCDSTCQSKTATFDGLSISNYGKLALFETQNITVGSSVSIPANSQLSFSHTTTDPGPTLNLSGGLTNAGAINYLDTGPVAYLIHATGDVTMTGGTYTASSSTFYLDGSSAQTLTSASQSFYNLTVTNASASGVSLADSATVTGTFTDTTASSKLTFDALSTYAFANINLNGQAPGTEITMVSNDPANLDLPSRQWYFNVSQSSPTATYVNVTDSDANGGNAITPVNSVSGGNNENWLFDANSPPDTPSNLSQYKLGGVSEIEVGGWTRESQVTFSAIVSDTDSSETLYLCVEKDTLGTAFSSTNGGDLCGDGVAYSGSPVVATVIISGLTDAAQYHWQAQVKDDSDSYSSFVSFGANTENPPTNPADRDFGVDTSAPTGGTIYDGTDGTDDDYNSGSLSSLSAFWTNSEPNFDASGKLPFNTYSYAIGTTAGGNDTQDWTYTGSNGTNSYIDATGLTLKTGQTYFISVKATDQAGNVSAAISSDGQAVAPTLTFSYASGSAITFDELNSGNSWTDSGKTTVLQTSTNAYGGYIIKARAIGKLSLANNPTYYIDHYGSSNSSPSVWSGSGFGYTTSDSNLSGGTGNRFTNGGPKYAGWTETSPGDPVADHTDNVTGTPISNEQFTIAYHVTGSSTSPAGKYQTTIIYTCIPQY